MHNPLNSFIYMIWLLLLNVLDCRIYISITILWSPNFKHFIFKLNTHVYLFCVLIASMVIFYKGHVYGLTPVCLFKWNWHSCFPKNAFPKPSNGQKKCWALSWSCLCTWAKWLGRFDLVLKTFLQSLHKKRFPWYRETCVKRSPLGQRQSDLIRQVIS